MAGMQAHSRAVAACLAAQVDAFCGRRQRGEPRHRRAGGKSEEREQPSGDAKQQTQLSTWMAAHSQTLTALAASSQQPYWPPNACPSSQSISQ